MCMPCQGPVIFQIQILNWSDFLQIMVSFLHRLRSVVFYLVVTAENMSGSAMYELVSLKYLKTWISVTGGKPKDQLFSVPVLYYFYNFKKTIDGYE